MILSNTQRSIRKAFIANGMIDEGNKMCPSFEAMMKTLPKKVEQKNTRNHD